MPCDAEDGIGGLDCKCTADTCLYTNNRTCSGNGVAQYDGSCICTSPTIGTGPSCSEYTNNETCSGNGVAQPDGSCECTSPETGVGLTCSEYTNSETCSSNGIAQANGNCVCARESAGPRCEYTDSVTCSDNGYAQEDGSCRCNSGLTGTGPTCSEYTDAVTCNGNGAAQDDGSCSCDQSSAGPSCEYTHVDTCSNNGVAQDDGSCDCQGVNDIVRQRRSHSYGYLSYKYDPDSSAFMASGPHCSTPVGLIVVLIVVLLIVVVISVGCVKLVARRRHHAGVARGALYRRSGPAVLITPAGDELEVEWPETVMSPTGISLRDLAAKQHPTLGPAHDFLLVNKKGVTIDMVSYDSCPVTAVVVWSGVDDAAPLRQSSTFV